MTTQYKSPYAPDQGKTLGTMLGKAIIVCLWLAIGGVLLAVAIESSPENAIRLTFAFALLTTGILLLIAVWTAALTITRYAPKYLKLLEALHGEAQHQTQYLQTLADNTHLTACEVNALRRQIAPRAN